MMMMAVIKSQRCFRPPFLPSCTTSLKTKPMKHRPGFALVVAVPIKSSLAASCYRTFSLSIIWFLDIRAAFDSVNRSALWQCLLRKGVRENNVSVFKELYCYASCRVTAYGQFSLPFVVSRGVRHGCPISPFPLNFAIEDVVQNALCGILHTGV